LKIRFGFLSAFLLLILLFIKGQTAWGALCAALLHEFGHWIFGKSCGIGLKEFQINLLGARLMSDRKIYSYRAELILCVGGPIVNLTTFCLLSLCSLSNPLLCCFRDANLALGLWNLLPIQSLDGGRILENLLCLCLSPHVVSHILRCLSFLTLFSLWSLSVYFLMRFGISVSLFLFSLGVFFMLFLKEDQSLL